MAHKALLVGINRYQVPGADLRGCVNDVKNVESMLKKHFDFKASNIKKLTDSRATQAKIKKGVQSLLRGAKAGDVLLFHYSGHGANVPDDNARRDEADRTDEILCPYDLDWFDPLRDDWLREQFNEVPKDVNLTVLMDCCHSGSITRALPNPTSRNPMSRYLPSPWDLARSESRRSAHPRRRRRRRSRTNVVTTRMNEVLITGCRDDQTSADAWIQGRFQGAMTSCLVAAVNAKRGNLTYRELHKDVLRRIRRYTQRPQLEGKKSHVDRPFLAPFVE